jgi:hypothetical protein
MAPSGIVTPANMASDSDKDRLSIRNHSFMLKAVASAEIDGVTAPLGIGLLIIADSHSVLLECS